MQEIVWKIDDLLSKTTSKLNKDIGSTSLTLDVTLKDVCNYCKNIKGSCRCGYNSNYKKELEIKATIKNSSDLKTDLAKTLFNEELSDFTFIINNEKIPVSKFILSARSPVFCRMFNSEFKEKNQNHQILSSACSKEAFKELIRYIYIAEVYELSKHVYDLLHASDFYQIDSLKKICEEELQKILVENNASKIFQYAHLYQCSDALKSASFDIIKKIFKAKNYTLPQELINNPPKVAKLFEIKDSLENEMNSQTEQGNKANNREGNVEVVRSRLI